LSPVYAHSGSGVSQQFKGILITNNQFNQTGTMATRMLARKELTRNQFNSLAWIIIGCSMLLYIH